MVDYQQIGQTIRRLREQRRLSQEGLASHLSETANTVSRWETGTYRPSAAQLESLARFFEISIATFFPDMENQQVIPTALLSATRGLNQKDLDEVIQYAEFRKARMRMRKPKKGVKSDGD